MTTLSIRVATKDDSDTFFKFFQRLKGKKVLIEGVELAGLAPRNVKNIILFIKEE